MGIRNEGDIRPTSVDDPRWAALWYAPSTNRYYSPFANCENFAVMRVIGGVDETVTVLPDDAIKLKTTMEDPMEATIAEVVGILAERSSL